MGLDSSSSETAVAALSVLAVAAQRIGLPLRVSVSTIDELLIATWGDRNARSVMTLPNLPLIPPVAVAIVREACGPEVPEPPSTWSVLPELKVSEPPLTARRSERPPAVVSIRKVDPD